MRDFEDLISECKDRIEEADRETGAMANMAQKLIIRNIYADVALRASQRAQEYDAELRAQWEAPRLPNIIRDRIRKVA